MSEPLERRVLLTTTLFLDFGLGIGMGNTFSTTVGEFRNIDGPGLNGDGTGSDMTLSGMDLGDSLDFTPLAYDFNGDGVIDDSDLIALADAVVPIIARAMEPFDIDIQVVGATNLADMVAFMGLNAGDPTGEFDAYNVIMTVTSDVFGGGSVGANTGLFGIAAADDLFAQNGNLQDEATLTFTDRVLNATNGTPGTAQFNQNLAFRLAYTAAHEAFHTFTYVHTPDEAGGGASADQRLLASGDIIRRGSVTREDPFIVTRFDLEHGAWANVAEPNNYLLAANDPDIGLRDSNGNGIPDLAYVTGTGAHDRITLTNLGGGIVEVLVEAYNNTARTNLIAAETYTIDLATDTEGVILVDASINHDEVIIDATIQATFRIRGGTGLDGAASEADLVTIISGGLSGTWTPGPDGINGTAAYAGGATIIFEEFENADADGIPIVIDSLMFSSLVLDEGDTIHLSGSFVNIDTLDFHEVIIDWGDGGPISVVMLNPGERNFVASYTYLDDNPSGIPVANYTITLTITDEDGDSGMAQQVVTVHNVDPVIASFGSSATFEDKGKEGEPVTITAPFTDVGVLDTHTAFVDWGDGSPVEMVTVNQQAGGGTVTGSHAYAAGGIYLITLTLVDDDTGTDTATAIAVITGVGVHQGVLYVIGDSGDNQVTVNSVGRGNVRVHADFIDTPHRTFALSDIDQLVAWLCDGDDHMSVSGNVTLPAIIHGGPGNDTLIAGGGPSVLDGGAGNDLLVGGRQRNILIGGTGRDRLIGGRADDVLIGASTTIDDDDVLLMAALVAWNNPFASYEDRVADVTGLFTAIDDGEADTLTGGAGRDLFIASLLDEITDRKDDEMLILI